MPQTAMQQTPKKGEDYKETTTPLLRPGQVADFSDEKRSMESMLQAPDHIRNQIQDVGAIARQLNSLSSQLDVFAPRAYESDQTDIAIRREKLLREQIVQGMPTAAEQRRNPPGNVDKHIKWEKRNKQAILEWKNIRLRLHASGALDLPAEARDVANIEVYQPHGGPGEADLSVAQIVGKDFHFPPSGIAASVVLTEDELGKLKELAPDVADRIAMMASDFREQVKNLIAPLIEHGGDIAASEEKARRGRPPKEK